MRNLLSGILLASVIHAAEDNAATHLAALADAYRETGGYIATYRSETKGKTLDATLARDSGSGVAVIETVLTIEGKALKRAIITADDGETHFVVDGSVTFARRLADEMRDFTTIAAAVQKAGFQKLPLLRADPCLLLTADSVDQATQMSNARAPWAKACEGAEVARVTTEFVEFKTPERGLLRIGREDGILRRQSISGHDGEVRVLELVKLRTDLAAEDFEVLTAARETADAAQVDVDTRELVESARISFFQMWIDKCDDGGVSAKELYTALIDDADPVLDYAAARVRRGDGTCYAILDLRKTLDLMAEAFIKKLEAPDAPEPALTIEKMLATPEVRAEVSKFAVMSLGKDPEIRKLILADFFGRAADGALRARTPEGRRMKEAIEGTLAMGWLVPVTKEKMEDHWGPLE